jgi:hypothetical protein
LISKYCFPLKGIRNWWSGSSDRASPEIKP